MTSENWRAIVGFEGLYEVSDQGRARTLGRIDTRGHRRPARLLTPSPDSEGYLKVGLTPARYDGTPQKAISAGSTCSSWRRSWVHARTAWRGATATTIPTTTRWSTCGGTRHREPR
jgi:hypothetical protein